MSVDCLIVCGDPGGGAAVIPVVKRLVQQGQSVEVMGYAESRSKLKAENLSFKCLETELKSLDKFTDSDTTKRYQEAIEHIIAIHQPISLLVSTSVNHFGFERIFTRVAKRMGIPVTGVLDFWTNYLERFGGPEHIQTDFPDTLAVMDERAQEELIQLGIDSNRLCVTGQPAFEATLARFGSRKRDSERLAKSPFNTSGLKLLFVSQPLKELKGLMGSKVPYDELITLERLTRSIEGLKPILPSGVELVVRPHPREKLNPSQLPDCQFPVRLDSSKDVYDCLEHADIVIGMTSALLIDACLLQKPTLSIQLGGSMLHDPLPVSKAGACAISYDEEGIGVALRELALDGPMRVKLEDKCRLFQKELTENATENVIALINQLRQKSDRAERLPMS